MPEYRDREVYEPFHKPSPRFLSHKDRLEESQTHRRARSRDSHLYPHSRSPAYSDYGYPAPKSVSPTAAATVGSPENAVARRRHSISPSQGQLQRRYYYESDADDTDSDTSSRKSERRKKDSRGLRHKPCSDRCNDNPKDEEEDLSDYSSSEEAKAKKDRRKNIALTAGLACLTSAAATNGLYQTAKGYHARKNAVKQGEMCTHEEQKLRNKAMAMDMFSIAVLGISANNVRLGWQRYQTAKKLSKEQEERAMRKREKTYAELKDREYDGGDDYDYHHRHDRKRSEDYGRHDDRRRDYDDYRVDEDDRGHDGHRRR